MSLLGAVLAGGQSRRFGADKSEALLEGRRLIDHVRDALARQCDAVILCGKPGQAAIEDRPRAGLGPLGGLCAALAYGVAAGFEAVLSAPCDVPNLPDDLFDCMSREPGASFLASLPVVGLWPCALSPLLDAHVDANIGAGADRSLRSWAHAIGARPVTLLEPLANINTPDDLAAYHG